MGGYKGACSSLNLLTNWPELGDIHKDLGMAAYAHWNDFRM